jgi:predicted GIY-YIG superfamily endonuclease
MSFKNIDYGKTVIYKIICKDSSISDCYVGSTTNFTRRKTDHKCICYNKNSNTYYYPLYKFIRENKGWNNFEMIEIEKYPCDDGNEARARERYYI